MAFPVYRSPAVDIQVNGGTVTNYGPDVLFYRDDRSVSSTVNDGSIASGSDATLLGTQWFVSAGRANIDVLGGAASSGGGGGTSTGNGRVLKWDGETYNHPEWHADTSEPREFRGPEDPDSIGSVVLTAADTWTPTEEPVT